MLTHFQNLTIVGTSHISRESHSEVMLAIEQADPDVIALELDSERLQVLFSRKREKSSLKNLFSLGFQGFLFALIGEWAERKLGKIVGVEPGDEMKIAAKEAKKRGICLALIDQDIRITLRRLHIPFKEKMRLLSDFFKGIFGFVPIPFDLSKTPSEAIVILLVKELQVRYPSVYKTLIEDRNIYMARNLDSLMKDNRSVVVVVGAGHVKGMISLLKRHQLQSNP